MFVRTTRNGAGQAYYHLVESYRSDGKVKQRTLLSLGRVEDGKLEQLAEAIAKHTDLLSALDVAKTVGVENTYVLGPLLVLRGLFAQLGIDEALERLERAHPKLEFSLREVVFALVAARFVRPASKLAVYEQMLEEFYPDTLKPAELDLQICIAPSTCSAAARTTWRSRFSCTVAISSVPRWMSSSTI